MLSYGRERREVYINNNPINYVDEFVWQIETFATADQIGNSKNINNTNIGIITTSDVLMRPR